MKKINCCRMSYVIIFMITATLLIGCSNTSDGAKKTIESFINKHYTITDSDNQVYTKGDIEEYKSYTEKFKEFMTEECFNYYNTDRTSIMRAKGPAKGNFNMEVKNFEISEGEKSGDMRCFDVSFTWVAKDKEKVLEEKPMNMKIYLSEEDGQWKLNASNKFYLINEKLSIS